MSKYIGTKAVNLSTTSADVTGNADIDGNLTVGGNLTVSGTTITVDHATAQTVDLGDNDKIRLGDDNDLQIYHSGTNSFIDDVGTGNLQIRASSQIKLQKYTGENMFVGIADGAASMYYDNSQKIATTATGVTVTGTVVADALTVSGEAALNGNVSATGSFAIKLDSNDDQGNRNFSVRNHDGSQDFFTIYEGGDAYLYDDSGNAKFFWDASFEGVGIGTTTMSRKLNIQGDQGIRLFNDATDSYLDIDHGTNGAIIKQSVTTKDILFRGGTASGELVFETGGSEAARVDSSGNLLVGKTTTGSSSVGSEMRDGTTGYTATFTGNDASNSVLSIMRNNGDGELIRLRNSSGNPVGTIRTYSDGIVVGNSSSSAYANLRYTNDQVFPCTTSGGTNDNAIDLGKSNSRFNNLWLSGGVYLGGTGSSNKLDDYEQGSWTPALNFSSVNGTATYTARDGQYTKIGNMVYVTGVIIMSSLSGESGDLIIAGLPFTVGGYLVSTSNEGSMIIRYINSPAVSGKYVGYFNDGSTTAVSFSANSDISSPLDQGDISGSTSMRFDGWYHTN